MKELNTTMFRAYDIRGIHGKDLTPEVAKNIGNAFGNLLGEGKTVVVGRDLRKNGEELKRKLNEGLNAAGCNVIDIGISPTPMTYFAINHLKTDGGVAITGSHLPPEYNGFKLARKEAMCLTGESGIYKIRDDIMSDSMKTSKKRGSVKAYDISREYVKFVLGCSKIERPLKVVVDLGNGTSGQIVKDIIDGTGVKAEYMFFEMDDSFPNHIPDPLIDSTLAALQKKVVATKADFGISLDGDRDRVGYVDNKGRIVRGDVAMMLYVKGLLSGKKKEKILFEVRCSRALYEYVAQLGGVPKFCPVGHSIIQKMVKDEKALFAGELSGHYYFLDSFGYDDGIFSAVKMLETMSREKKSMSELIDSFPRYESTPEIRISYPDEKKFDLVRRLGPIFNKKGYKIVTVDGLRVEFEDGWGLVRVSNTEPKLVLRFEAKTKKRVDEIQKEIMEEVKREANKDKVPV